MGLLKFFTQGEFLTLSQASSTDLIAANSSTKSSLVFFSLETSLYQLAYRLHFIFYQSKSPFLAQAYSKSFLAISSSSRLSRLTKKSSNSDFFHEDLDSYLSHSLNKIPPLTSFVVDNPSNSGLWCLLIFLALLILSCFSLSYSAHLIASGIIYLNLLSIDFESFNLGLCTISTAAMLHLGL